MLQRLDRGCFRRCRACSSLQALTEVVAVGLVLLVAGHRTCGAQGVGPNERLRPAPEELVASVIRQWKKVPKEKWDQTLALIADESAENFGKLKTWHAVYAFQDTLEPSSMPSDVLGDRASFGGIPVGGRLLLVVNGRVTLDLDVRHDKLRTRYAITRASARDVIGPTDVQPIDDKYLPRGFLEFEQVSLVDTDGYIHFQPKMEYGTFRGLENWGPRRGRACFRDRRSEAERQPWGIVVDPRAWFGTENRHWWEEVRQFIKAREELRTNEEVRRKVGDDWLLIEESDDANEHRYRITFRGKLGGPKGVGAEIEFQCSGDCAFNLVEYRQRRSAGPDTVSMTWEYSRQGDVFVPSKVVRNNISKDGDRIEFQRILTLVSSEVNTPIPEETFTLAGLGLQPGDRYIDRVEGVGYVWDGSELGMRQVMGSPPLRAESGNVRVWLVVGNLVLIALLLLGVLYHRHARSKWLAARTDTSSSDS